MNCLVYVPFGVDFFRQKSKTECKTNKGNFRDLTNRPQSSVLYLFQETALIRISYKY